LPQPIEETLDLRGVPFAISRTPPLELQPGKFALRLAGLPERNFAKGEAFGSKLGPEALEEFARGSLFSCSTVSMRSSPITTIWVI
jgi:hypothetical protein